ncbi:NAD(+) diphosphatase [Allokutzneria sp. A3M-2-11 16]|uniref:NAD(+) diphosphatase n=1 Tax=Allokutzneria sp. A3M-2-11 16 TaxID=2962043 RepID=UPI0020B7F6CE|nr:NAD(+) diphosphatase [Allokutzneria sp. A3M-2-11 16]MCP3805497.1 NAD(+) diphosphatase [Allokutzneria sp. A3M-2-11 16]
MTLMYCGLELDRAANRRGDRAWLEEVRASARVLPLWRDKCLVGATCETSDFEVFLGMDGDTAVFAADLSTMELAATGASEAVDVRRLFGTISAEEAATLAYARGILHWNRNQRFCGACGGATESREGGHLRACQECSKLLFPRIEPAVIVLVESPVAPKVLLGRPQKGGFCTLAGFVEIGESLEDAVRREVFEEAGVVVGDVRYQASQAWPFPSGLMVGFRATAVSEEFTVDGVELAEAKWFTPDELRAEYPCTVDSIEGHLVREWLATA